MDLYLSLMSVLMVILVLIVPKGMFVASAVKCALQMKRLPFSAWLSCYIPLYNNVVLMRVLYEKYKVQAAIAIVGATVIFLKVLQAMLFNNSKVVNAICVVITIIVMAVVIVNEIVITHHFAVLIDCGSWTKTFSIICTPLANFTMSDAVVMYFKANSDEIRSTFQGED